MQALTCISAPCRSCGGAFPCREMTGGIRRAVSNIGTTGVVTCKTTLTPTANAREPLEIRDMDNSAVLDGRPGTSLASSGARASRKSR